MWCRLRNFTESRFYKRVIFASPALILPCFGIVNVRKHDGYGSIPPRCHIFGQWFTSKSPNYDLVWKPKDSKGFWSMINLSPRWWLPSWQRLPPCMAACMAAACRATHWWNAWRQGRGASTTKFTGNLNSFEKIHGKTCRRVHRLDRIGHFFLSMREELHICRSSQHWKNAWQAGADITKVTNNWGSNGPTNRPFLQTFQVL